MRWDSAILVGSACSMHYLCSILVVYICFCGNLHFDNIDEVVSVVGKPLSFVSILNVYSDVNKQHSSCSWCMGHRSC